MRLRHEDNAKRALGQAEADLNQAKEKHEAAIAAKKRYEEWIVEEEDRRYAAIFNTKVSVQGLADFREGLANLAHGLVDLEDKVLQAAQVVNQCQEKLNQCRADYFAARRETMKIEEHRKIWLSLARKEEERVSELEMEECVRLALASDDV